MNPSLISIILPVYNAEKSIGKCIESIQNQDYKEYELIIVNDGSTDASQAIIDEYAKYDNRIRTVNKANGGVSSARNAGIEIARGEYITFIDADDTIGKHRIKAMVNGIGEADILISGLTIINEKGEEIKRTLRASDTLENLMIAMMEDKLYGYMSTKLIKKEVIEANNIRFDENIHWREDDVFVTDYLAHTKKFAVIKNTEYYYILPPETKTYKGTVATQCTERLFEGYEKIFGEKIPHRICELQEWAIKGEIERLMLNGNTPSETLLKYYKDTLCGLQYSKHSLTHKIRDYIILRSRKNSKLSIWLIKTIHKMVKK